MNQTLDRRIKQACLISAPIEPIREFVAVAAQVLYRNLVKRAVHAALEQRERAFNRLCMVVADRVAPLVVNHAVSGKLTTLANYLERAVSIGLQDGIGADMLF